MEFGISTFGEIVPDKSAGNAVNAHRRIQELIEEAKLADHIGLDVYALGEHHREDYVVSAPEVVLAGAAAVTKNIKLSSAVTVLSSADPVRTFQNFATLDLISSGRAEIMAGRGSFIESFPLFGYDLDDYNELFTEKLGMLLAINKQEKLSWKGQFRTGFSQTGIYPRPYQQQLPVWIAVGGTPASVARAGALNLPLTIAILGGNPRQFASLTQLYRKAAAEAGHEVSKLQLAINEHMYLAETGEKAANEFWPIYEKIMNKVGRERGWSPMSRQQFEYMRSPDGPLLVGSPEEVINKLADQYSYFNNTRFLAQTISGDIPHEKLLNSIELFGTVVAPAVRKRLETA
ncbi:MAG: LLM class flavin-dependent oxidoreductase [Sphingobacteriales bacterium]|nr:MAG: LLM class flavin-dependent oxidoreductase [Sphingobacteriales bacterium]